MINFFHIIYPNLWAITISLSASDTELNPHRLASDAMWSISVWCGTVCFRLLLAKPQNNNFDRKKKCVHPLFSRLYRFQWSDNLSAFLFISLANRNESCQLNNIWHSYALWKWSIESRAKNGNENRKNESRKKIYRISSRQRDGWKVNTDGANVWCIYVMLTRKHFRFHSM